MYYTVFYIDHRFNAITFIIVVNLFFILLNFYEYYYSSLRILLFVIIMCADGPADDIEFDNNEEFIWGCMYALS